MITYRDPFSLRAEEIARQAILRADIHGMKNYGPAPAPSAETRDMIEEAIEELLDEVYHEIRQVAGVQDLLDGARAAEAPGADGTESPNRLISGWIS